MYTPAININNKKADPKAIYHARQWPFTLQIYFSARSKRPDEQLISYFTLITLICPLFKTGKLSYNKEQIS